MNGNKVLGIVFANVHEEALDSLTAMRTMGSVPFCSRFRLIDFPLSNMVASGITKIGVVTNANFQSLMDHVGTGKPWDLSRKNDGLYLLPPFSLGSTSMWGNRIDALYGNMSFLQQSNQTYVLISDCNNVLSVDYSKLFDAHEESGADITILGVKSKMPNNIGSVLCFDKVDEDGRIREMSLDKKTDGEVFYSCNIMIMKKYLLETLVTTAHSKNEVSYQRNIIMANVDKLKIHAYDATDSFVGTIDSIQSYYDISMSLLEKEGRSKLFKSPISTKERDDMPTIYGPDSSLKNSLVADGCIIKGTVENCIIFKGVQIGEDTVVKDSIIMQDTVIGRNAKISCIISDKKVSIKDGVELSGASTFPICLTKGTRI
ncbi:MAG: glucose-1-phosphate adenylyltransferase subunit GlgD [Acetobacter sp.]|nr:glucose-1-phosphate adenylyltransferase subunit GlgD [Bacteroides sp.]MCM1340966.1 glucose-1-phosphate adenylyltransferase subunit GlgD [Acetobacter sp.]MCM1432478.1 glucose-1-phosphate adenylyltransferase subunit GlgD [Clostridiales bacterium]